MRTNAERLEELERKRTVLHSGMRRILLMAAGVAVSLILFGLVLCGLLARGGTR